MLKSLEEVKDGEVRLLGPDLSEMTVGGSIPFGICIEVAGVSLKLTWKLSWNAVSTTSVTGSRGSCTWTRETGSGSVSIKKQLHGASRLIMSGRSLYGFSRSALPIIERISVTIITDPALVHNWHAMAVQTYEERDARTRGMTDEDVDVFYGCSLCQSFAPSHVCVITPERYANCGAIHCLDGAAASRVDPRGPIYEIQKGVCIDPETGEYEGVNRVVKEKSLSDVLR